MSPPNSRAKSYYKDSEQVLRKCGNNDSKKSLLHSYRNYEQTEFEECMLLSPESSVLPSPTSKTKD